MMEKEFTKFSVLHGIAIALLKHWLKGLFNKTLFICSVVAVTTWKSRLIKHSLLFSLFQICL